ncbi:hypothetical protein ABZT04_16580 [Streptomyces sp. NPDC005492]|uniref:hypothetical protein n=1 Tax=Streptomyces sp. NPDC005492 TaxID=3156883 RepID=UPI0033A46D17
MAGSGGGPHGARGGPARTVAPARRPPYGPDLRLLATGAKGGPGAGVAPARAWWCTLA